MSRYYTDPAILRACGVSLDKDVNDLDMPRGCTEPTRAYGTTEGIHTFEEAVGEGIIQRIPEKEWPEWIEHKDRTKSWLLDRLIANWVNPLSQGRIGYCWTYAATGALMLAITRDTGLYYWLAAARNGAMIKGGRDQGGWPVDAAAHLVIHGTCLQEEWKDCACGGKSCKGPRGGCQARDLSRVEETAASAARFKAGYYVEFDRRDREAYGSLILQDIPVGAGWVGTGAWCDGHAMLVTRMALTQRSSVEFIPENSWKEFKRRVPVAQTPTGGVGMIYANLDRAKL